MEDLNDNLIRGCYKLIIMQHRKSGSSLLNRKLDGLNSSQANENEEQNQNSSHEDNSAGLYGHPIRRSHQQLLYNSPKTQQNQDYAPYNMNNISKSLIQTNYNRKMGQKSLLAMQQKQGQNKGFGPMVARHDIASGVNKNRSSRTSIKHEVYGLNDSIAHSRQSSEQIDIQMDTLSKQIDLAASQKSVKPVEVALDQINKYVGYRSETMSVSLTETSGWMKKLVNEVKMIQKSIFPKRYYKYNRVNGNLSVLSKPDGSVKQEFKVTDILFVKQSCTKEQEAVASPDDFPYLLLLSTTGRQFYLYAATAEERDIWVHEFANFCTEQYDSDSNSVRDQIEENMDPFLALEVQNLSKHMMEKMAQGQRQIQAQNNLISYSQTEKQYNPGPDDEDQESVQTLQEIPAEKNFYPDIPDPNMSVEEMSEYYQSQISQHKTKIQQGISNAPSSPTIISKTHYNHALQIKTGGFADGDIIAQTEEYVQFFKAGEIQYVSRSLKSNESQIEGTLIKKSGNKMAQLSKSIVKNKSKADYFLSEKMHKLKYVKINFEYKRIIIQERKGDDSNQKLIQFTSIGSVQQCEISEGEGGSDGIEQYMFKFQVKTLERIYQFFARSELERQLWMDHFQRIVDFIQNPNGYRDRSPVHINRQNVLLQQSAAKTSQSAPKFNHSVSASKVINQNADFIEYAKGDFNYFLSSTLKAGGDSIEGEIIKKTRSKIGKIKPEKQYVTRHVLIDFKAQKISFQNKEATHQSLKQIDFSEIKNIEVSQLDVWDGEAEIKLLEGKEKLYVYTKDRTYEFYAKGVKERDIWLQYFCRIIDINTGKANVNNEHSDTYKNMNKNGGMSTKYKAGKQLHQSVVQGYEEYTSATLSFDKYHFKGYLMKRIEKRKLIHLSNFHSRHYEFSFHQAYLFVREKHTDELISKHIPLNTIRACTIKHDNQEQPTEEGIQKSMKRSKSWLSKMRADAEEICKWNFSFELELTDRTLELYAPTRIDREKWVMMFKIIVEMNDRMIKPTNTLTPLIWQRQNKDLEEQKNGPIESNNFIQPTTQSQEESKQTPNVKTRHSQDKNEQTVVELVEQWLVRNVHLMSKSDGQQIETYESTYLTLKLDRVEGLVYVVAPQQMSEQSVKANLNYERQIESSGSSSASITNLTKCSLNINISECLIVFELTKDNRSDVVYENFTFQEVQDVSESNFVISEDDITRKMVPTDFNQHCFKIKFRLKGAKLIACGSKEDRSQWMRTIRLIAQINRLNIDTRQANIFVFERLQIKQFLLQKDKQNIQVPSLQLQKQSSVSEDDPQEDVQDLELKVQQNFVEYYSPTFTTNFRYIEGYMTKNIENRQEYHFEQFHIRFFRLIFSTGKLIIKQDRRDKKMRSTDMSSLLSVDWSKEEIDPHTVDQGDTTKKIQILSKLDIMKKYQINEEQEVKKWKYNFGLQFTNRRFELACRTLGELENWLRVFNLAIAMNAKDKSLETTNPFVFEQQHGKIPFQAQVYREEIAQTQADSGALNSGRYFDEKYETNYYYSRTKNESNWIDPARDAEPKVEVEEEEIRGPDLQKIIISEIEEEKKQLATGIEGDGSQISRIISSNINNNNDALSQVNKQDLRNNLNELKNLAQSGYNPIQKLRQKQPSTNSSNMQVQEFMRHGPVNDVPSISNTQSIPIRNPHHQAYQGESILTQMQEPIVNQNITVQNITIQSVSMHQPPKVDQQQAHREEWTSSGQNKVPAGHEIIQPTRVMADLENPQIMALLDNHSEQAYGNGSSRARKKKKKKKKRLRDRSAEVTHQFNSDYDFEEGQRSPTELSEQRKPAHFRPASALAVDNNFNDSNNKQEDKFIGRVASVVSVIDGGFTGFSDSDDDDNGQSNAYNDTYSKRLQTPTKTFTPKPMIIKASDAEEMFGYYPNEKLNFSAHKKELITIKSANVVRKANLNMEDTPDQTQKRKSAFLQKFVHSSEIQSTPVKTENTANYQDRLQNVPINCDERQVEEPMTKKRTKRIIKTVTKRRKISSLMNNLVLTDPPSEEDIQQNNVKAQQEQFESDF